MAPLPWLCQTRRCHFSRISSKFLPCRPQWAEARRAQDLVFGAAGRKCLSFRRATPVKRGSGGADDCERPLCEGAHRNQPPGHFWFLFGQTKRNPPRRAESSKNKSGSDGIRHSHRKTVLQAKRQSEALQEVLLPTFLSRKVGQHFSKMVATPWPPPMHRVARPFLASSRLAISCSRVTMIRAPEAPTG